MTKRDTLAKRKNAEQEKADEFQRFMLSENFTEGISKSGNFGRGESVFYKKMSNNKFLVFNIPYYGKVKDKSFYGDFWRINATSEKDFLENNVADSDLIDIRLGFTMQNIDIYQRELTLHQA